MDREGLDYTVEAVLFAPGAPGNIRRLKVEVRAVVDLTTEGVKVLGVTIPPGALNGAERVALYEELLKAERKRLAERARTERG